MQIAINTIHDSPLITKLPDSTYLGYKQLKHSIQELGLTDAITVRPSKQWPNMYEIVHGHMRVACCRDLGHTDIEATIKEVSDEDMLRIILATQTHRLEPASMEYALQIRRLMELFPQHTMSWYAGKLSVTPNWLKKQLMLTRLAENIQDEVRRGRILLGNAYALAKMPKDMQQELVPAARTLSTKDFNAVVEPLVKKMFEEEFTEHLESRQPEIAARPILRRINILMEALDNPEISAILIDMAKPVTPIEHVQLGVKFALQLDPLGVKNQIQQVTARLNQANLETERQREIVRKRVSKQI